MAELLRLNVVQLEHSSNRLERLTKWLIALTVALVILTIALLAVAIPPLLKASRCFSRALFVSPKNRVTAAFE